MSKQFSFYATYKDEEDIFRIVLSVLGNFYIIPERGDKNSMTPKLMSSAEDLSCFCKSGEMFAIIKENFIDLFQLYSLNNDKFRVDYHSFPCLEYSRSIEVNEKTIALGRLVYFYDTKHPFTSDVQRLFRNLKKSADRVTEKIPFWIFGEASRRCEELVDEGPPWKNPKFQSL